MQKAAIFFLVITVVLVSAPSPSFSEGIVIGKVKGTSGITTILRDGKYTPAFPNDRVLLRDTIVTGSNGAIGILLIDNTLISMGPISRVAMNKFNFTPSKNEYAMRLQMIHGTFVYQSGLLGKLAPHAVELDTPVGTISMLKSTDFKASFPK